jgi:hypothetical protein
MSYRPHAFGRYDPASAVAFAAVQSVAGSTHAVPFHTLPPSYW